MAKAIAAQLSLPFIELDAFHNQEGWAELPEDEFQARVKPIAAGVAWVIDGNYTSKGVQDLVWERADTVVWLDLPRSVAMRRVIARTIRRAATREVLWNGNREPWSNFFDPRPHKNIIVWTWTRHRGVKEKYERKMRDAHWSHLEFVRLHETTEVDRFLEGLTPGA